MHPGSHRSCSYAHEGCQARVGHVHVNQTCWQCSSGGPMVARALPAGMASPWQCKGQPHSLQRGWDIVTPSTPHGVLQDLLVSLRDLIKNHLAHAPNNCSCGRAVRTPRQRQQEPRRPGPAQIVPKPSCRAICDFLLWHMPVQRRDSYAPPASCPRLTTGSKETLQSCRIPCTHECTNRMHFASLKSQGSHQCCMEGRKQSHFNFVQTHTQ